jgi:dTDP-4-dehydrorhamnose reductase
MWVVTGADGQLGRALVRALSAAGIEHAALTRSDCDISSEVSVRTALADVRPAVVVNAAAWTAVDAAEDHPEEAALVNEHGAKHIAAACKEVGSRLVHISTDYVFDGTAVAPIPEDAVCRPGTEYGRTKLAGETAVLREHGSMTYIVRTAWLYSEHGSNFAKTMMRRAVGGVPVSVVNDQVGQPTNAHTLAGHVIDLVTSSAPYGIYHGTNSGQASWCDFARSIFALAGADPALVTATDTASYPTRATRPKYSVLAHGRTTAAGLAEMRPWEDALAASLEAIKNAVRSEQQ